MRVRGSVCTASGPAVFSLKRQLLWSGDVSHNVGTGTHPFPTGTDGSQAGKVLSSTIVINEKWRPREVDRNSPGGGSGSIRLAHVIFLTSFSVCGGLKCHQLQEIVLTY